MKLRKSPVPLFLSLDEHTTKGAVVDRFYEYFRYKPLTDEDYTVARALLLEADSSGVDFNLDSFVLRVFHLVSRFGRIPWKVYTQIEEDRVTGHDFIYESTQLDGWSKSNLIDCVKRIFEKSPEKQSQSANVAHAVKRLIERDWLTDDAEHGLGLTAKGISALLPPNNTVKQKKTKRTPRGSIPDKVIKALKIIERCHGNMSIAEAAKTVGCATSTLSRNPHFVSVYESHQQQRTADATALQTGLSIRNRKHEGLRNGKRNI